MNTDELYARLREIDPLLPLAATTLLRRCANCTCGWKDPRDISAALERMRASAEQVKGWVTASHEAVVADPTVAGWFEAAGPREATASPVEYFEPVS